MKAVRLPLAKIATVTVVVAVAMLSVLLLVTGVSRDVALESATRAGLVITASGVFWGFYNRWGWKLGILRLGGWLSPYPDLNGRWEGILRRTGEDEDRPFVLEIRQTWSTLSFHTFSRRSQGHSDAAFLTFDEDQSTFGVVAVWQSRTNRQGDPLEKETFRGTSLWRIALDDQPGDLNDRIRIVDEYYTSRRPATSGVTELRRVSKHRRNSFQ